MSDNNQQAARECQRCDYECFCGYEAMTNDRKQQAARELPKDCGCFPPCDGPCHAKTSVPEGVYFSDDNSNFYSAETGRGMGGAFFTRWFARRDDFPKFPCWWPDCGHDGNCILKSCCTRPTPPDSGEK